MSTAKHEPRNIVPTHISDNAWAAAMTISLEVERLLNDYSYGFYSRTIAIAKMVQLSINQSHDDLLDALKAAYSAMNYLGDILNGWDTARPEDVKTVSAAFEQVRAAIAKAEGGAA